MFLSTCKRWVQEVIDENLQEQQEEENLPKDVPKSKDAEEEGDNNNNNNNNNNSSNNNNNNNKEGGADATVAILRAGCLVSFLPDWISTARLCESEMISKGKNKVIPDTEVTCKSGNKTMKWNVIADHEPTGVVHDEVCSLMGLKDFNSKEYLKDEVLCQLFYSLPSVLGNKKLFFSMMLIKNQALKGDFLPIKSSS
jgi:hypothetical protein